MRWAVAGLLLVSVPAVAQTPVFEVASVKPQPWTGSGSFGVFVEGNTLRGEHCDLAALIGFAYGLTQDEQLSGGPAWVRHGVLDSSTLYRVQARATGSTVPSVEGFRAMLRGLLAERFQLQIHHVSRDLPVYNLVIAKGGPKLKENTSNAANSFIVRAGQHATNMTATHVPLKNLTQQTTFAARRPVIDRTGLAGFYDFEIAWAVDDSDSGFPTIFTALQEKLGLKLESATAAFDTIVIDRAEKPSEN